MNISITARKFKAHDTLKEFINNEVVSLEKYIDNILNVDVILSYLNSKENVKTAEIILQVPGQTLTAEEKLSRQLQKLKSKKISHKPVDVENLTPIDIDTDINDQD